MLMVYYLVNILVDIFAVCNISNICQVSPLWNIKSLRVPNSLFVGFPYLSTTNGGQQIRIEQQDF